MSTNKPTNKSKPTPTQARASRRERRQNRRRVTRWLIGIAIGLVAALLILGLFLPMLGNLGDTMSGVPEGPGEKFESQGTEHIEEKASHPVQFNTCNFWMALRSTFCASQMGYP